VKTSVKYMVIYRHKEKSSISEMCRFFEISASGYFKDVYIGKNLPQQRIFDNTKNNMEGNTDTQFTYLAEYTDNI